MNLQLVRPSFDLQAEFMAMVDEFLQAGEREYVQEDVLFDEGFVAYVDWLARGERGELDGLVPWSAYWTVDMDSNTLIGISSLRHELSPWLAEFGGHIGYRVRPSQRRQGAGTTLLRLTLNEARARGVAEALIVCTPDNLGSQGVLRRCGARFEREVVRSDGVSLMRFWVPTGAPQASPTPV